MNSSHDFPEAPAGFPEKYVPNGIYTWLERNADCEAKAEDLGADLWGNDAESFLGMSREDFDRLGGFLHQKGSVLAPGDGVDGTTKSALLSFSNKLVGLKTDGPGGEKAARCSEDVEGTLREGSEVSNDERAACVLPTPNLAGFRLATQQAQAKAPANVEARREGGRTCHGKGVTSLVGGGVAVLGKGAGFFTMSVSPGSLKGVRGGGQHKAQATGRPPPPQTSGNLPFQQLPVCLMEGGMRGVSNAPSRNELGGAVVHRANRAMGPAGQVPARLPSSTQPAGVCNKGLQQDVVGLGAVKGDSRGQLTGPAPLFNGGLGTLGWGATDGSAAASWDVSGGGSMETTAKLHTAWTISVTMRNAASVRGLGDHWHSRRGPRYCHARFRRHGGLPSIILGCNQAAQPKGTCRVTTASWRPPHPRARNGVVLLTVMREPRRGAKDNQHGRRVPTTYPREALASMAALTKQGWGARGSNNQKM